MRNIVVLVLTFAISLKSLPFNLATKGYINDTWHYFLAMFVPTKSGPGKNGDVLLLLGHKFSAVKPFELIIENEIFSRNLWLEIH